MATNSTIFKNKNNAKKFVEGNKNYVNIFNFSKDQPKIIKYNASKENVKNYIKGNLGNNKLNKLIEIIFNVHLYVRSRKNGDNKLATNVLSLAILLRSKYGSRLNAVLSNTFGRKNNQTPTKIKEKSFMKALSLVSNNKKYKGININKNLTINKVISLSSNKNLSRYNVIVSLMHSVVDSLEGNGTIPPPRMPKPSEPVGNNFVNELNKRLQNILLGLKNIKNPTPPPKQPPTPSPPTPPKKPTPTPPPPTPPKKPPTAPPHNFETPNWIENRNTNKLIIPKHFLIIHNNGNQNLCGLLSLIDSGIVNGINRNTQINNFKTIIKKSINELKNSQNKPIITVKTFGVNAGFNSISEEILTDEKINLINQRMGDEGFLGEELFEWAAHHYKTRIFMFYHTGTVEMIKIFNPETINNNKSIYIIRTGALQAGRGGHFDALKPVRSN